MFLTPTICFIVYSFMRIIIAKEENETASAIESAKNLFDDMMKDYQKLRRPVEHSADQLTVYLHLRLSQILKVNEKDQIITTLIWLRQEWYDPKLTWNPADYGGVKILYVPYDMIWTPDIVLYNNGDSKYHITIETKATVDYNGVVVWEPPAVFKSFCEIDVQWFPFDEQKCFLKFGSWTYPHALFDLQHYKGANISHILEPDQLGKMENVSIVTHGVDLSDYCESVQWEILEIPAKRHNRLYQSCCPDYGSFVDITYYFRLRRKFLFYSVNVIIPCVGVSFLTMMVFYLPSDSGERVQLCITILLCLFLFLNLMNDVVPATSVVLPLIGKYLLFTMTMVSFSVVLTVLTLNIHFRKPSTHIMPKWVKTVFMRTLPKYLFMRRPLAEDSAEFRRLSRRRRSFRFSDSAERSRSREGHSGSNSPSANPRNNGRHQQHQNHSNYLNVPQTTPVHSAMRSIYDLPEVRSGLKNVCFIADLLREQDRDERIDEDWKYVAMVIDRLFFWIFFAVSFFGTAIIMFQAQTFYETKMPLNPYASLDYLTASNKLKQYQ